MKVLGVLSLVVAFFFSHASAHGILLRDEADDAASLHPPPAYLAGVHAEVLPDAFTWRDVVDTDAGRRSLLTVGGNQHIPKYCGCCYAFGAMHTLQDRVKIARHFQQADTGPDLIAAVQVLLNCFGEAACSGGSVAGAWAWARDFQGGGVPVEGCQRYVADDSASCTPAGVCENCMGTAEWTEENRVYSCFPVPGDAPATVPCFGEGQCRVNPYPRLGVTGSGKLTRFDAAALMREVAARGPVTCSIDATPLLQWDGRSVVEDAPSLAAAKRTDPALNDKNLTDHSIEVVGWGLDASTGVPYWEFRNSWGEFWGDAGFGRIRRGRNDLNIESDCDWVLPSGWGVPSTEWHVYSSAQVEAGAAALVRATALAESVKAGQSADEWESDGPAPSQSEQAAAEADEAANEESASAGVGLVPMWALFLLAAGGLLLYATRRLGPFKVRGGYDRAPDVAAVELSPYAPARSEMAM